MPAWPRFSSNIPFALIPWPNFSVNGEQVDFRAAPDTPLLWAIRDHLGLTGTKYGCGMALCGACTVHIDGQPARSCVTPVSSIEGKRIVTIEGIGNTTQAPRRARGAGGVGGQGRGAVRLLPVGPGDGGRSRCSARTPRRRMRTSTPR